MATVLELITEALVTIKALAVGETPEADMTEDALNRFAEVLEALSLQNLAIYANTVVAVPLLAGVAAYTLGPGGVGQRPISLNSINSMWVTYQGSDFPVQLTSQADYDVLPTKDTGGIPAWAAFNNGFPNTVLTLYPAPDQAAVLNINQQKAFDSALGLGDNFDMPAGYRRMVRLMLAWDLRNDYPGLQPDELAQLQSDTAGAIGSVKRANSQTNLLRCETAWIGSDLRGYGNWRDGT